MTRAEPGIRGKLALMRPFHCLLAFFALARWLQGSFGVPYERGHFVFSIVTLTVVSCVYYGAFARRWRGYSLMECLVLGVALGLSAQIVIFAATLLSYGLGLHTYFNHPIALNAPGELPLAEAIGVRLGGLLGNSIFAGLLGVLGWALGGLLPKD